MKAFRREQTSSQNNNSNLRKDIGMRLKNYRQEHRWTQVFFASKCMVSSQSILRYEKGESDIPMDILASLHENQHIDLNFLICGDASSNATAKDGKAHLFIEDLKELIREYGL